MSKRKDTTEVVKERKTGSWAVRIDLSDGRTVMARPGYESQRVIYDRPQIVPRHLKYDIVPKLIEQCRLKMLKGE